MADWLFELYSEEIPAGMQISAAEQLSRLISEGLTAASLAFEGIETESTPRRLVASVRGLSLHSPSRIEEKKGPRQGAPEQAIAGFLRSVGAQSVDDLTLIDHPKGAFYQYQLTIEGLPAEAILETLQNTLIRKFSWPKSMRWGRGSLTWVRPLRSVLSVLFVEGKGRVIPFSDEGIESGNKSCGHPLLAPQSFPVPAPDHFARDLEKQFVILSRHQRESLIVEGAQSLAQAEGLNLVDDPRLVQEVVGLVEWPVPLMGRFDPSFLALPDEVIRTSIRVNQKCFVTRDPKSGRLANAFITVANRHTRDQGQTIIAGNEKVIAARLSDARFFWQEDLKTGLDNSLPKLASVLFHAKLGTLAERVERLVTVAACLAGATGRLDNQQLSDLARATLLCKADLVSGMVGEFPELQGLVGGYYAREADETNVVSQAISDHYRPQGPADSLPGGDVGLHLSLADKIELMAAFWSIDERPSGSRDPYALRRAALGSIRLIEAGGYNINLRELLGRVFDLFPMSEEERPGRIEALIDFLKDRLRHEMKDRGLRHDIIEAVMAREAAPDLLALIEGVNQLTALCGDKQAREALAALKRVNNILRAEEGQTGAFQPLVDGHSLVDAEETGLWDVVANGQPALHRDSLSALSGPIRLFFDNLMVNDPDPEVRSRRLSLLTRVRATLSPLADFSLLTIEQDEG